MSAFIVACLSLTIFNVTAILVVFGLMTAKVPPPDINGWVATVIFTCAELSVWGCSFVFASYR